MAEKDRQTDDFKTPRRPDILRARDIIPGADSSAGKNNGVNNTDIPQFDLADDIMAEHRRLIANRRKGPGSPAPVNLPPSSHTTPDLPVIGPSPSRYGFSNGFKAAADPVIADIVARDIERLCRGLSA